MHIEDLLCILRSYYTCQAPAVIQFMAHEDVSAIVSSNQLTSHQVGGISASAMLGQPSLYQVLEVSATLNGAPGTYSLNQRRTRIRSPGSHGTPGHYKTAASVTWKCSRDGECGARQGLAVQSRLPLSFQRAPGWPQTSDLLLQPVISGMHSLTQPGEV